jgi:nicotinamidase/pyrazinamidase
LSAKSYNKLQKKNRLSYAVRLWDCVLRNFYLAFLCINCLIIIQKEDFMKKIKLFYALAVCSLSMVTAAAFEEESIQQEQCQVYGNAFSVNMYKDPTVMYPTLSSEEERWTYTSEFKDFHRQYPNLAFLIIDPQNDFEDGYIGPNGQPAGLPVPGANAENAEKLAKTILKVKNDLDLKVLTTADSHNGTSKTFARNIGTDNFKSTQRRTVLIDGTITAQDQTGWPDHCVIHTNGVKLFIHTGLIDIIIPKGLKDDCECYSGLLYTDGGQTGLQRVLSDLGVDAVVVAGEALTHCVKATVLDLRAAGINVFADHSLCHAIPDYANGISAEGTGSAAIREMEEAGARIGTIFETV